MELQLQIAFNLLSAPFGFAALYYGYKGYRQTKNGLKAYGYFLLAMFWLGAVMLLDLLRMILGLDTFFLIQLLLLIVAACFFLAFKDLYHFLFKSEQ